MGGSSPSGGNKSGGNKSGGNKSNSTSKYFKSTSTPKRKASPKGGQNRVDTRSTPKASTPKKKATPKSGQAHINTTSRSDVKLAAPRPKAAVKAEVTAKGPAKVSTPSSTAIKPGTTVASSTAIKPGTNAKTVAAEPKTKATPKGGANHLDTIAVADPKERHTTLLQKYQATPTQRDDFNADTYADKAKEGKNSKAYGVGSIIQDKYRNDEVSYNQAYWKGKKEGGATQAEMAAEQKALGSKKIYSGDRAITKQDQRKSKYILDSLAPSGIKPTVTEEKKGLLNETLLSTSSYDIGTGKPIVVGSEKTSPMIGGKRFGDDVTKTYVDGVATWTEKGVGDDSSITTSKTGAQNDRVEAGPDAVKEIADIDSQIKTETDPVKLKALHKRRLMLMRLNNTNTRFAGLLDDADTKRSNLMSIG